MRRRLAGSLLALVGACSYALPRVDDTSPWRDEQVARRCIPDTLAPQLDSVGLGASYAYLGVSSLLLLTYVLVPESSEQFPGRDFNLTFSASAALTGLLGVRYYRRSRDYGYEMAHRCQEERLQCPAGDAGCMQLAAERERVEAERDRAHCVVDRRGPTWLATVAVHNVLPGPQTYTVVTTIAAVGSESPGQLTETITLGTDERAELRPFATRQPITSCSVELIPTVNAAWPTRATRDSAAM